MPVKDLTTKEVLCILKFLNHTVTADYVWTQTLEGRVFLAVQSGCRKEERIIEAFVPEDFEVIDIFPTKASEDLDEEFRRQQILEAAEREVTETERAFNSVEARFERSQRRAVEMGLSYEEGECLAEVFGRSTYNRLIVERSIENLKALTEKYGCARKKFVVRTPTFDDIVKIAGPCKLTRGDLAIIKQVKNQVEEDEQRTVMIDILGEHKVYCYEKKVQSARRIYESPTPEIVREIGEIMTMIDNVQDGLVTLNYIARIAGFILKRLSKRVFIKFIPIVGWISLAKDVLDIINLLGWLLGPRAMGKRALKTAVEFDPKLRGKRLLASNKITSLFPSFREAIQIAQTTEYLFGYGISLGPIVGFFEDAISGLTRAAVPGGPDVRFEGFGLEHTFEGGYTGMMDAEPEFFMSPGVKIYNKPLTVFDMHALKILRAAPFVLQLDQELTAEDRTNTLSAVALALEQVSQSRVLEGTMERLEPVLDVPIPAPKISSTVRDLLDIEGIPHNGDKARYPLPIEAETMSPRLQHALLAPLVVANTDKAFTADKDSPYAALGGQIMAGYTDSLLRQMNGAPVLSEDVVMPPGKTLFTLLHWDLLPKLDRDPASLERVYGLMTAKYYESGRDQYSYEEAVAIIELADGFKTPPERP